MGRGMPDWRPVPGSKLAPDIETTSSRVAADLYVAGHLMRTMPGCDLCFYLESL